MLITSVTATLFIFLFPSVYSLREKCCEDLGVPEKCYKPLCNPSQIPRVMLRYKLFDPDIHCHPYLLPISQCLSKGRDVSTCCHKEAFDIEFTYCYGLCNGTMNFAKPMKDPFLSCFVLNVVTIFPCLVSSYTSAPSEPRELEIVSKTKNSAVIKWKEPEDSPELLDHYEVHLIERTGESETETILKTGETEYNLENLTLTRSYTVHVVAHGAAYKDDSNWYKSIISNVVFFTTADEISVSKSEIELPGTTKTLTLYCKLRLMFGAEKSVEWTKITNTGVELLDQEKKYSIVSYQSEIDSNTIVSALKIMDFDDSNFATYRCYIKKTRIEYSETVVTKFDFSEKAPEDNPPETLLDCCSRHVQREKCKSICTTGVADKKTELRPGMFLSPPQNCQEEVDKLFKCSLANLNSAGCCIHSKVAYHCLGMCDIRFNIDAQRVKSCRKHVKEIYKCKLEAMSVKPEAVSNVNTTHIHRYTFRFMWDKSLDAKVYHVYQRKNGGAWMVRVTLDHTVDITDSDEVVLVSVNEFGHSEQHRLYYDADGWSSVDRW